MIQHAVIVATEDTESKTITSTIWLVDANLAERIAGQMTGKPISQMMPSSLGEAAFNDPRVISLDEDD